ncbi:PREDICTED: 30S ribosomal protein S6 alpha, chloroplastic isoform X2 [Nelumbo nucifera]|uniref:30S ribosomal protein S6 alpha, chloroplastic isoform X2 n=1 Tax=Nelumbo nucifera TaxID=4432 RepID=A0A1U8AUH5_NELNU|nr:PREDICTED: 30S ribosomal protein S6 alpha, chloroplastic isoform X2 [Nelumbo nucifera]
MASLSLASTLTSSFCPKLLNNLNSSSSLVPSFLFSSVSSRAFLRKIEHLQQQRRCLRGLSVKALTLDFSGSFFESGVGEDDPPTPPGSSISVVEGKEEPQCPPGLRQYETMAVLRPDMSEDERLALTQKYEEDLETRKVIGTDREWDLSARREFSLGRASG